MWEFLRTHWWTKTKAPWNPNISTSSFVADIYLMHPNKLCWKLKIMNIFQISDLGISKNPSLWASRLNHIRFLYMYPSFYDKSTYIFHLSWIQDILSLWIPWSSIFCQQRVGFGQERLSRCTLLLGCAMMHHYLCLSRMSESIKPSWLLRFDGDRTSNWMILDVVNENQLKISGNQDSPLLQGSSD